MDVNHAGTVSYEEALGFLRAMLPEYADDMLKRCFDRVDIKGTGSLSWKEFLALMAFQTPNETMLHDAFQFLDIQNTGKVSVAELWRFLAETQPGAVAMSPFEIQGIIREIDINNDGVVDFDEFVLSLRKILPNYSRISRWERCWRACCCVDGLEGTTPKFSIDTEGSSSALPLEPPSATINGGHHVRTRSGSPLSVASTPSTAFDTKRSTSPRYLGGALSLRFRRNYTSFWRPLTSKWEGWVRLLSMILVLAVFAAIINPIIWLDLIDWPGFTDECGRVLLTSFRALFDILILIQDWEFPTFSLPHKPGKAEQPVFSISVRCTFLRSHIRRLRRKLTSHNSGADKEISSSNSTPSHSNPNSPTKVNHTSSQSHIQQVQNHVNNESYSQPNLSSSAVASSSSSPATTPTTPAQAISGISTSAFEFHNKEKPLVSVYITGKWFNYGILFLFMLFDFVLIIKQCLYKPDLYNQIATGDNGMICNLPNFTRCQQNTRFTNDGILWKLVCTAPAVLGYVWLIYLIAKFRKTSSSAALNRDIAFDETTTEMQRLSTPTTLPRSRQIPSAAPSTVQQNGEEFVPVDQEDHRDDAPLVERVCPGEEDHGDPY
eukprot:TRINITY_DN4062_c0_g1_i1.p1 TRINITY_DN4062_c0_g1~~TRINITY_DN4062_c0_g1_i1.p1  ORF type:complete len:710 (+),score=29.79 TRINITY_DN4062_c0_g1_i1:316-2130(+)